MLPLWYKAELTLPRAAGKHSTANIRMCDKPNTKAKWGQNNCASNINWSESKSPSLKVCLASYFHNSIFPTIIFSNRSQIVPDLERNMGLNKTTIHNKEGHLWNGNYSLLSTHYLLSFVSSSIPFHLLTKHNWKWHFCARNYAKLIPLEVNNKSFVLRISALKDHQ